LAARSTDLPGKTLGTPNLHSHSYDSGVLEKLLFRVAKRWVAGNAQNDAIASARQSNSRGMNAILNYLGEDTVSEQLVEQTVQEYLSLISAISSESLLGCVSAKPTQLGLAIGYDLCLQNAERLAQKASSLGQFLWLDIESANYVENTIKMYSALAGKNQGRVGLAVQAYLRRSQGDLEFLLERNSVVRLVKGAYQEPASMAFSSRSDVDLAYSRLMGMLFENGGRFAIATHDSKLIEEAIQLAGRHETSKDSFEFQMLMGIRDDLKPGLVERGFRVSEYIPYGNQWLPYSVRRLRERKRNVLLLARSLV
jgi:proline dehydrogenase